jgi:uncharacterized protein
MDDLKEVKKFILHKLKKELPKSLTYHSTEHIKDVYRSAKKLAKMEKVKGEDLMLLLTAVLFHDSGFLWQQYQHEMVSCEIVNKYLPGFGYSQEQIDRICGMIMATKIPQTPHNLLEQIICDSDLDYLGRDDFFQIGNGLYKEMCMYGIINNENDWNRLQVRFLENHTYFTESAKKLRKARKEEYIALVKSRITEQSSQVEMDFSAL